MYCGKRKLAQIKDLGSNDLQDLHSAHITTCEVSQCSVVL